MKSECQVFLSVLLLLFVHPLVQAQEPELVLQKGHSSWISGFSFHPDGRWLASAGDGVKLWEMASGRLWRSLRGHAGGVNGVAFSPDGRLLATCSEDQTVKLWDVTTGRLLRTLDGHASPVNAVAFSPDGQTLASASGDWIQKSDDYTVRLWEVETGRETGRLTGHTSDVNAVVFGPDGRWLATVSDDKTAKIWDRETGRAIRTLRGHTKGIKSAAFSPDGRLLATASYDRTIRLWEADTGRVIRTLGHRLDITTVRFSPDGRWLASTAYNDDVKLWEVESGRALRTLQGRPGALAFSPDGRWLATKTPGSGRAIRLWDVDTWRVEQTLGGKVAVPFVVAASADGDWLFSTAGNLIRLWEMASGRVARTLTGHEGVVLNLALNSDASRLASVDNRSIVKLWEVASGRAIRTLQPDGAGKIRSLALSPDGRLLAGGIEALGPRGRPVSNSLDNAIKLWSATTGREVFTLTGHTDPVHALAFSPDGRRLASGSGSYAVSGRGDNSVRLWNVQTGQQVHAFYGHSAKVNSVAFSPDGNTLASGSGHGRNVDNSIKLWDLRTGRELWQLTGHEDEVRILAFSPNGDWLASGSNDNTVKLWAVRSGRVIRTLRGHSGSLTTVAFTPDGRHLVSGSQDGSMRLWDPAGGEELASLATMGQGNEWVVVSPPGLFDGSAQGMQVLVAWRIGRHTYPPDRYFADFYTPGLLARLLAGERPAAEVDLAALDLPPDVRILSPGSARTTDQRRIDVVVEVKDRGGGVAEVQLYHNGKLIATLPGQPTTTSEYVFRDVTLIAGENRLRASALNEDRVESNEDFARGVRLTIPEAGAEPPSKATLHLLVVGINRYEDPAFNLDFARPDAKAIAGFFGQPGELFSAVNPIQLADEEATSTNIRKALDELVQNTRPEDVLLIYLAGHGMALGQQFYFLPHEMRKETAGLEAAVSKYGMPATELGDALYRAEALKQVLIIDACQSEGALNILRQTLQRSATQKALEMLARSKGVHLIAASTKEQYAFEVPELGHGVLTYALLCGLGTPKLPCSRGEAPQPPIREGIVTVTRLIGYISDQVPELTEKYHNGNKQYPVFFSTGMDFPLWVHDR